MYVVSTIPLTETYALQVGFYWVTGIGVCSYIPTNGDLLLRLSEKSKASVASPNSQQTSFRVAIVSQFFYHLRGKVSVQYELLCQQAAVAHELNHRHTISKQFEMLFYMRLRPHIQVIASKSAALLIGFACYCNLNNALIFSTAKKHPPPVDALVTSLQEPSQTREDYPSKPLLSIKRRRIFRESSLFSPHFSCRLITQR